MGKHMPPTPASDIQTACVHAAAEFWVAAACPKQSAGWYPEGQLECTALSHFQFQWITPKPHEAQ